MRQCAKILALALCAGFAFTVSAVAQNKDAAKGAVKKAAKEDPKALARKFPVAPGYSTKGLRFPYSGDDGKRKMDFYIEELFRKDEDNLQMTNAKIITFDDDGKKDFTLLLPQSLLNLTTRLLTSDQPFVLIRDEFQLLGETLELDTVEKKAKISGKVTMVIFNIDEAAGKGTKHE